MKYIIRETFCPGILIFIRYNEKCNTCYTMQTQMKFQRSVSVATGLLRKIIYKFWTSKYA